MRSSNKIKHRQAVEDLAEEAAAVVALEADRVQLDKVDKISTGTDRDRLHIPG